MLIRKLNFLNSVQYYSINGFAFLKPRILIKNDISQRLISLEGCFIFYLLIVDRGDH